MVKKVDSLFFAYVIITSILIVLGWNKAINPMLLLGTRGVITFGVFVLIYIDNQFKNKYLRILRLSYPLILSGFFYQETVFYNKLFFDNFDPLLTRIDAYIFGSQPSLTFSAYFSSKAISEVMYFSYFSFYLLILGFALYIFVKQKLHFEKAVFYISATMYVYYLFFALFPAAGPQFSFLLADRQLPDAYFFDSVMHFIQETGEQPTGAFPSSHVSISVMILILSKKITPNLFKLILVLVILIIFSTVYIKAHYAIDIVVALLAAPLVYKLAEVLYKRIPIIYYDKNKRS